MFGNSAPGVPLPDQAACNIRSASSKLPSNLAISFRDRNGTLYAGDPEHRAVGDVRVIYRIIPAEKVEIIGTQHGDGVIVQIGEVGFASVLTQGGHSCASRAFTQRSPHC